MTDCMVMCNTRERIIEDALGPVDARATHAMLIVEGRCNTVGKESDDTGRVSHVGADKVPEVFGLFLFEVLTNGEDRRRARFFGKIGLFEDVFIGVRAVHIGGA